MVETLHRDCCCCLSRDLQPQLTPVEATLVILHMLNSGCSVNGIIYDLCFEHRRQLELARGHDLDGL